MGIIVVTAVVVVTLAVLVAGLVLRAGPLAGTPGPRLAPGFAPALLAHAGFPTTAHNVAVLHDHLGSAFLDAARPALPADAFAALLTRCLPARGGVSVVGGSARSWPQRVLDELTAHGTVDVAGLPRRCQDDLLATAGTGRGVFGGSVFAPLPALPGAFPTTAVVVPAPRAADVADRRTAAA